MKKIRFYLTFAVGVSVGLALGSSSGTVSAQEPKPATAAPSSEEVAVAQQALRAYLLAQEQLRAIQRDIEQSHKDAESAAQRNAEAIAGSLNLIAQNLATQRERELGVMHDSNRVMLMVAGSFAGVGFLAMVFTAWFQMRSLNRLTEVARQLHVSRAHDYPLAALGAGDAQGLSHDPVERANAQFLGTVAKLQKRIQDLEQATAAPLPGDANGHANGNLKLAGDDSPAASAAAALTVSEAAPDARLTLILGKGQTFLHLGQPEAALACFEEALTMDSANLEALLKKGTALERLQRMEEAIESYDRAIAADNSKTTAYLLKGGVFNRLKRYPEALACYDAALRAQQKAG